MDGYAHRYANRLVGNRDNAAALEVTLLGPELQADTEIVCVVAGAQFDLAVNGTPVSMNVPFAVPAGGQLRFGNRLAGTRATLAVRGGFDLPATFGSRATSLVSRMGPFGGRALVPGDILPVGPTPIRSTAGCGLPMRLPEGGSRLRVVTGPHDVMFTAAARETFLTSRFIVTPQSNRMGYRLEGPPLRHISSADILSDATPIGSLQVPASGQPILLMADRQTTGGYPKIATVITADLPVAGQLAPGDWIEFAAVSRAAAVDASKQQEARLTGSVHDGVREPPARDFWRPCQHQRGARAVHDVQGGRPGGLVHRSNEGVSCGLRSASRATPACP
jgi:antagonist of KipI